jgi:tRNA pseudouridine55 synthase
MSNRNHPPGTPHSARQFEALPRPHSVDGLLIVDKPAGWTSHDVVAKVRGIMKTRRVGHTGTLDPFATGVLVICLNQATRLAQFLTADDKEYVATVRFGYATDTGDLTGTPLTPPVDARHLDAEKIQEALTHFRGKIRQTPPMYSAKKIGGVKLYEMARRGEEIERQPVEVEIKELVLCNEPPRDSDLARDFVIRVVCSSGTYIRTLAEDIGKHLGIGAHLTQLRRTRAGRCEIAQAMTLEELAELARVGAAEAKIISMNEALRLPEAVLDAAEVAKVAHGNTIRFNADWAADTLVKLLNEEQQLIAVAEYKPENRALQPRVVLVEQ